MAKFKLSECGVKFMYANLSLCYAAMSVFTFICTLSSGTVCPENMNTCTDAASFYVVLSSGVFILMQLWKRKKLEIKTFLKRVPNFLLAWMKSQWDESGGRILLGDNRWPGGRAVADQVPVCCSLDFNDIPLYILTQLAAYVLYYDVRKIGLGAGVSGT